MKPETRLQKDTAAALLSTALGPVIAGLPPDAPELHSRGVILLACGVTHQSVADQLGVDRVTVSRWASRYKEQILDIRTLKAEYIRNTINDTLVLIASMGFIEAQRLLNAPGPKDWPQIKLITGAIESATRIMRPTDASTGVIKHLARPDKRLLKEAESRFRALQSA